MSIPKIAETTDNTDLQGRRDAFHVAAVLVTCETDQLRPGDNVRFTDASYAKVVPTVRDRAHAIVDPFLEKEVGGDEDELFWVLLTPDSTSGLHHQFDINTKIEDDEEDYSCRMC